MQGILLRFVSPPPSDFRTGARIGPPHLAAAPTAPLRRRPFPSSWLAQPRLGPPPTYVTEGWKGSVVFRVPSGLKDT